MTKQEIKITSKIISTNTSIITANRYLIKKTRKGSIHIPLEDYIIRENDLLIYKEKTCIENYIQIHKLLYRNKNYGKTRN